MTSSITLGGIRDVDLGFRVLEESKEPLLPSTRDIGVTIPGKHGQYDFGADLTERAFSYSCAFVSDGTNYDVPSPAGLQQRVRTLARHLTDSYGRPRIVQLIRAFEPDKFYLVRYAGSASLERLIYNSIGLFELELVAFDPFAYSVQEHITEQTITSSPTKLVIESEGTIRSDALITLTNIGSTTLNSFKITNEYQIE
ncbi:phage tail domain-containing protein [Paenibacillus graminis]|uniref:Siphovirus-type tail component RIFT-related domain-containing protein n=1 Tax=Paenibacillus graminis TaxID=189425 RepID=A0A089MDH8_9BACL|nr:phage tail domain-containing protein [Paenibacillus graminis]AIQ69533.1 hypothetical protein PGRAT_19260 [Paenibacillus graminis]